jgi:hypothetical protein
VTIAKVHVDLPPRIFADLSRVVMTREGGDPNGSPDRAKRNPGGSIGLKAAPGLRIAQSGLRFDERRISG